MVFRNRIKNKLIVVTVLLIAAAVFAGCGGKGGAREDGIELKDGTRIALGAPVSGEPAPGPVDYVESKSCIGSGTDVLYKYEGFSVTGYPDGNGGHRIGLIRINGEGPETFFGIGVGMTRDDVVNTYGAGDAAGDVSVYEIRGGRIIFYFGSGDSDGTITEIVLTADNVS